MSKLSSKSALARARRQFTFSLSWEAYSSQASIKSMAETEIKLQTKTHSDDKMEYGVLLYYKYADIPDIEGLFDFYKSNCTALSLLGRVRLSAKGVNVTVGGRLKALEEHIEALKESALFEGTDFKLASCGEPLNDRVARECGFTSLCIRIVKELVTLSSHPLLKSPDIKNAGRHLTAAEFHSVLQDAAGKNQEKSSDPGDDMILLDARNLYETRIGKFDTPNVKTLDPEIRQYSDLPLWIDDNSEQLRGKKILMYCTGGIRCEMASAYIRSKGPGFENVFQLYGGIQRYMEQIPDGGFFKGKNFVFDHRVSVGSLNENILGTCLVCSVSYDDYTSRCRCTHCRMLVLVCDYCREKSSTYICELCQRNGKPVAPISSIDYSSEEASELVPADITSDFTLNISSCDKGQHKAARKLRVLCLHGFRQNASGFKGRTASLAKKLKNVVEFVFVDAPHELPFIYQPPLSRQNHCTESNQNPPTNHCNRKFAWLVSADYHCYEKQDSEWRSCSVPFDSLQYQQQTEGLEKSIEYLKTVISQEGPFDGILGFSQGAAMAALVGSRKEELKGKIDFRFVMCCSGFAVSMPEYSEGSINCPSIHIFGSKEGQDRQIDCESSRMLASLFENGSRVVIEHDLGHMIPTRSPYIDYIRDFLRRFV